MLLPVGRVFTHKVFQQALDVGIFQDNRVETDVFADKQAKLIGRYFAQAFKAGDFGFIA